MSKYSRDTVGIVMIALVLMVLINATFDYLKRPNVPCVCPKLEDTNLKTFDGLGG